MKVAILAAATLMLQRALGWPGMPGWASLVTLPMVLLVAAALLQHGSRWTQLAIPLGLGWDLLLEPVVGPGGIAWSVAALALSGLAGVVADRSPKAWFAFGAAGTAVMVTTRAVTLLPLGMWRPIPWSPLVTNLLATAILCGLIGWLRARDIPSRWRAYRVRKLR
jgi:hypothetical protein